MSLINLNGITRRRRNQQNFKDISPLPEIQSNLEEYCKLLTDSEEMVFNALLWFSKKFDVIYVSQSKLAQRCGISRKWVNVILSKFESDGILAMQYRHTKSSLYRISSFFTYQVRKQIAYIFKGWVAFSLALLFSKPAPAATLEKSSHNIKGEESYIYNPSVLRETLYVRARETARDSFKKGAKKEMLLPTEKRKMLEQLAAGIVPDNFPSEAVRNVSVIQLSKYGQVKLSAFPDHIIQAAENKAKKMNNLKSPFAYLFSTCVQLCREKNIELDFTWVDALKRTLKMDESCSPTIAKAVRPSSTIKEKLNSQWKDERKDIDMEKELTEAVNILKQQAEVNPFAAILMKSLNL